MTWMISKRSADITVDYTTISDGINTQNNDFVSTNGKLTISAGDISGSIAVAINGDLDVETDETFTLELSNISSNAILARANAVATIADDDRILTGISLPQTGQQNCFNSEGVVVPCAATGQDGDQGR